MPVGARQHEIVEDDEASSDDQPLRSEEVTARHPDKATEDEEHPGNAGYADDTVHLFHVQLTAPLAERSRWQRSDKLSAASPWRGGR